MSSGFDGVGLVVIGTAMNAANQLVPTKAHGPRDPFPVLIGGTMLAVVVSVISSYVDPGVGKAFAWVFLLGSFMISGVGVFGAATSIITGK